MNKPSCHYLLKARTAFYNSRNNEFEFKAIERKFEDESPILAREAAFKFRNEFIRGMLALIGKTDDEMGWNKSESKIEKLSDREIRKLINPYLEPEDESAQTILRTGIGEEIEIEWVTPDDSLNWYPHFNNGIWIILNHNDTDIHEEFNVGSDVVIDKITRYEEPLPSPPVYNNLEQEYQFYLKHDFDTKGYETTIDFFDDEVFLEGEANEDEALIQFTCLETPFEWSGYDKIYWWGNNTPYTSEHIEKEEVKIKETTLTFTMEQALNGEENQFCEFKPGLINWPSSDRNIEYEVVQSICAFLNAKGGYLFIGVKDNGEILGLDFSKISKDEFRRKFTSIKTHYLAPHIAHRIYGEFKTANGKEIFVITIYPNPEPVFLLKKDENNKFTKEFFVRSDAASRHIYDIEEIVKYYRAHWK